MALETDFELTEILFILIALGALGYFAYKAVSKASGAISDTAQSAIDNTTNFFDQISGASSAPGGVGSNTYTNALGTTINHPIDTFKSIFGF